MNSDKKVVVTGGAGFIGSHLAEKLVNQGYHVIILDNLSTGKLENIKRLLRDGNSEFIQDSITNLTLIRSLFKGVQYIFHNAAITGVQQSIEHPQLSHEVNVTGTLNTLLAAKDNCVRKVVYVSSASVYGNTSTLPIREEMAPNPLSPYAASKLAGEYYCHVFQEVYGLPSVCLRYFNIYGPKQDQNSNYSAVIPRFIKKVSEGSSPIIFGDGEQTRDFTFVEDAVEASILAAESNATGVFNIGRGEGITLNEVAGIVNGLMGKNMEPIHEEPRLGDIRHSVADIVKAKTFGYTPKYDLQEGLRKTIDRNICSY